MLEASLRQEIVGVIEEPDVERKLRLAVGLVRAAEEHAFSTRSLASQAPPWSVRPGRPPSWTVLDPAALHDRPRLGSPSGRYLLLHSVAHIELCAVELALAAVADFPDQPLEYHRAMLGIAKEEIAHTRMLSKRLEELGGALGSHPVHLALWDTAQRWRDLPGRLGVVPRILEARGLDVSARLREGLGRAGDEASARILERIYRDEIGHVRVGTLWFRAVCAERGVDPEALFLELIEAFRARRGGAGPIDREGRLQAGFTERELQAVRWNSTDC